MERNYIEQSIIHPKNSKAMKTNKVTYKRTGLFFLLMFLFAGFTSSAQRNSNKDKTMYGLGVFYNFQTESIGLDIRARVPLRKHLYVVPRFSYFPAMNKVHEFYLGADVNYTFARLRKFNFYALLGASYDNWINSSERNSPKAKQHNFVVEPGCGVLWNRGCLNPFLEYRYDTKWLEGSLGLGVLFNFGDCFSRNKKVKCPAFN
ncbi:MAG: hypothetical protein PHT69_14490 [Bacteroidales bacterium]|nr:hypothetical protein [Bacteroidales bacterium]